MKYIPLHLSPQSTLSEVCDLDPALQMFHKPKMSGMQEMVHKTVNFNMVCMRYYTFIYVTNSYMVQL